MNFQKIGDLNKFEILTAPGNIYIEFYVPASSLLQLHKSISLKKQGGKMLSKFRDTKTVDRKPKR